MQNAFKCYLRTRDYCTTSKHILTMCLNVICVSLAMGNYLNVSNYVQKAETTPDLSVCPRCIGRCFFVVCFGSSSIRQSYRCSIIGKNSLPGHSLMSRQSGLLYVSKL